MRRPEQEIHKALVAHLRARAWPDVLWWHTPQGAHYSSAAQGRVMKALGVLPGVSDLILIRKGTVFALELKAHGGKPTKAQDEFIDAVKAAGGIAGWAEGLDLALEVLAGWGLLRPSRGSVGRAA